MASAKMMGKGGLLIVIGIVLLIISGAGIELEQNNYDSCLAREQAKIANYDELEGMSKANLVFEINKYCRENRPPTANNSGLGFIGFSLGVLGLIAVFMGWVKD